MSNYCPRIHHGLALLDISNQKLRYAVCCWAKDLIVSENKSIDLDHPDIVRLRSENQQGILPERYCKSCLVQERAGRQSMRQGYQILHGPETYDNSLQYLDINIDYTCNLACVTCGPELSSTWRNELKIKDLPAVRPHLDWFLSMLDQIDLSHLKEIRFWGGEPFLTHTHLSILKYVSDRCDVSNIKLMYNTNGTCRIDEKTKSLIESFKFCRISFSIDAIGEKIHYIRYPLKWAEIEKNLMWWKENLPHNSFLSLTVTASVLNVLDLDEIYQWHRENWQTTIYTDPIEIFVHNAFGVMGLENMPPAMAEHLRNMQNFCQPWIQNLKILASNPSGPGQILSTLSQIDQRRGLRFGDYLPKLARFLNEDQIT